MDCRGQTSSKDRYCWPAPEVKGGVKEEMMKKFIYIIVAFMLMAVFIGCATMTPEQRKELYDSREINNLTEGVGNKPWVGSPNNLDARGQFTILTW